MIRSVPQLLTSSLIKRVIPAFRVISLSATVRTRRQKWRKTNQLQAQGTKANKVFAQEEVENIDALEDFINRDSRSGQLRSRDLENRTAVLIQRELERRQRSIKKKIMERKYFKQPQEINLLTWSAKEQIRYLHSEFPEEWTPQQLAESFPVSIEGVHRLLGSSYHPRTEEELIKHDKRVIANWRRLKKTLAIDGGVVQKDTSCFQHIIDTGKLPLMINAGGSSSLPMSRTSRKDASHQRRRQMGVFESIIAQSSYVKAFEEDLAKKKVQQQSASGSDRLLQDIAQSTNPQGNRRLKPAYIESGAKKSAD